MRSKRRLVILFWLHKYALISVISIIILQQLIILTIDYRAIPHECCSFVKIIFYLCFVKRLTDILESVFALSLIENVAIFYEERTTDNTHLLLVYGKVHSRVPIPHIYQVWGIASFILFGFATTFN